MYAIFCSFLLASANLPSQEQANAALVKKMFEEVSEKMCVDHLKDFFSEDLELVSNNHTMNLSHLKEHLSQAFAMIQSVQFKKPFEEFLAHDDKVVTRFTIATTDKKGNQKESGVIAIYQIKDGKIAKWWEVTYPDWKSENITSEITR